MTAESNSSGSRRSRLGRGQLAALSVASFVPASGMALMPYLLAASAGFHAWTSALVTVVGMIAIGMTIVSFATRFVGTGSLYSYAGEIFGRRSRYIVAASLLGGFVAQLGSIAGVIGIYSGSFLRSIGLADAGTTPVQVVIYICSLTAAVLISLRGLQASVRVAVTLALISVPLMLVITLASAMHTGLHLDAQLGAGFRPSDTFAGVAIGAAFFVGFESCSSLAKETRDPRRSVPTAVMAVPVVLGALYLVCTVLQTPGVMALQVSGTTVLSPPASLAVASGLGTPIATLTDLVLAVAMLAAAIGFTNYGARFVVALGTDGLLPVGTTRLHRKFGTPWVGLVLVATAALVVMCSAAAASPSPTVAYNAVGVLGVALWIPAYVVISIGAIRLALREKTKVVTSVVSAVFGAATMLWVYASEVISPPAHPIGTMVGLAPVLFLALLAILTFTGRRRPSASPELDRQTEAAATLALPLRSDNLGSGGGRRRMRTSGSAARPDRTVP